MRSSILIYLLGVCFAGSGQIVRDYVVNGSFEILYNCTSPLLLQKAKGWTSIDSQSVAGVLVQVCNNKIPKNNYTWQFPRTGEGYLVNTMYIPAFNARGNMRNRLKSTLISNHVYCVRFFINIANTSPRGMDGFGAYFADSSLDTITKCTIPLSYINPQVKNQLGNVISDTLNWVPITGTFVATGNEKYMVIGNFLADNAVTTSTINGPFVNEEWTDVCIDDVSCFDIDLPAYAGPDQGFFVGDSVFIGSNDPGLDEFCTWYQLPNMATPLATIAGLYVKPVQTTTYVVRQQLWCSSVKWDTVVVFEDALGNDELGMMNEELRISPNPARDKITVSLAQELLSEFFSVCAIYNVQGGLVNQMDLPPGSTSFEIPVTDLAEGLYVLCLRDKEGMKVVRSRVAIQR